jgi:hypothetical protein
LENPEPAKRWVAFLGNHREAIAAMDFFTMPTVTFGVLDCFFVIAHGRRRILHCNVTQIRPERGSFNSCAKRFPMTIHPST